MKICMVGLGSIGIRHLKNLHLILKERGIRLQTDALRRGNRTLPPDIEALVARSYYSLSELPDDYDAVFITNPTSLHFDTIRNMLPKTHHMFIEKPVFDCPDYEFTKLSWRPDGIYYVACPLRYHSVIRYLKEFVRGQKIYAVRAICSSFLPDWRPGTDYRQSYSAKLELGGGVRRDLIHEWDYLQHLFGFPLGTKGMHGTFSHLDISSEDLAVYTARYPNKLISLHLDYFGRFSQRNIELFMEDEVVTGDLLRHELRYLKSGEIVYLPQDRDEMQQEEIACFLDMLEGKQNNHNDVDTAVKILKIALGE